MRLAASAHNRLQPLDGESDRDCASLFQQTKNGAPSDNFADPVTVLEFGGQQVDPLLRFAQVHLSQARSLELELGENDLPCSVGDLVHVG
jgi:hypothetical protein